MAARMTLYKLVILGDGGVGKVCRINLSRVELTFPLRQHLQSSYV
jgi:hypothetical protein